LTVSVIPLGLQKLIVPVRRRDTAAERPEETAAAQYEGATGEP
jgi:hypothetical protein